MTSSSQYLIDILKQKYEHEVARRNVFDNVLSLPIALLSFVIPSIYLLLQEAAENYPAYLQLFLKGYIIVFTMSTLWTIHLLYRFYFIPNIQYKTLPPSDLIIDIYDTSNVTEKVVAGYFDKRPDDLTVIAALDTFLIKSYKECTAVNATINDQREMLFLKAKKSLGFTFTFAMVFFLLIIIIRLSWV